MLDRHVNVFCVLQCSYSLQCIVFGTGCAAVHNEGDCRHLQGTELTAKEGPILRSVLTSGLDAKRQIRAQPFGLTCDRQETQRFCSSSARVCAPVSHVAAMQNEAPYEVVLKLTGTAPRT